MVQNRNTIHKALSWIRTNACRYYLPGRAYQHTIRAKLGGVLILYTTSLEATTSPLSRLSDFDVEPLPQDTLDIGRTTDVEQLTIHGLDHEIVAPTTKRVLDNADRLDNAQTLQLHNETP